MIRAVLDTNVLLAALLSSVGASRRILLAALDQRMCGLTSVPLFIEYEAVLKRPKHLRQAGASATDVDVILNQIAKDFQEVDIHYLWRPFLKDPQDDMVLEAAFNGDAQHIITFNVRDFAGVEDRFSLRVSTPSEFLRRTRWI